MAKRIKTSDPTFNAIQELIFQYRKCEKEKARRDDSPVDLEYFMDWLVEQGWSYDEPTDARIHANN